MSVKTWVAVYNVAIRYAGVERPASLGWASSSDDKTIRLRLIHDRGSSAEACQSPTPWRVAEGASRLGRPLASQKHRLTSNSPPLAAYSGLIAILAEL